MVARRLYHHHSHKIDPTRASMVSYMYLIIILECVKSSLDTNILRKYFIFYYKDVMTADVVELEHSNNKRLFGLKGEGGGVKRVE